MKNVPGKKRCLRSLLSSFFVDSIILSKSKVSELLIFSVAEKFGSLHSEIEDLLIQQIKLNIYLKPSVVQLLFSMEL